MPLEDRSAFFYTQINTAPVTPTAGTSMIAADLSYAPAAPFYAVVRPAAQVPSSGVIAEVIEVTDYLGNDILSMTRDILSLGAISITTDCVMYQYIGKSLDLLEYMANIFSASLPVNFSGLSDGNLHEMTGFQITFTLPTAMYVECNAHLEFQSTAGNGVNNGDIALVYLRVDGVDKTALPVLYYQTINRDEVQTISRKWVRSLAAGVHTISLTGKRQSGTGTPLVVATSSLTCKFFNAGNEI